MAWVMYTQAFLVCKHGLQALQARFLIFLLTLSFIELEQVRATCLPLASVECAHDLTVPTLPPSTPSVPTRRRRQWGRGAAVGRWEGVCLWWISGARPNEVISPLGGRLSGCSVQLVCDCRRPIVYQL